MTRTLAVFLILFSLVAQAQPAAKPAAKPAAPAVSPTPAAAPAAGTSREDKVRALMQAQGMLQMLEQQLEAGKEEGRKQVQQVSDQMMQRINPPAEFQGKFRKAFEDYAMAMNAPWGAKEIVDVWAKAYGSRFTDKELDGLLAYYKSPLGQKDVKASQEAMPEMNNHFSQKISPILNRETGVYMDKLEELVEACKCPRK